MDIAYLEWMMRRSSCFVAVIPRRNDSPPYNCSPYQIFENGLAIRAKKPRLIFVEAGLDLNIFGTQNYEICSFRRGKRWLEEDQDTFMKFADRLSQRVHAFAFRELELENPVALLADTTRGAVSCADIVRHIRRTVRNQGYWFETINPMDFEYDFLFLQKIEQFSVLISEIRQPYITPDVLGVAHSRCVPTIWVCHLQEHESIEEAEAAMHLPSDDAKWVDQGQSNWPLIFSKYKVDDDMEPIIFWKTPEELCYKIEIRLKKITEKRVDLITKQEARNYFLRIGRLPGRVFISNAQSQNDFVSKLRHSLERDAVELFHYKRNGAIATGADNWLDEIMVEIRNSSIFLAVIDTNYQKSEWCNRELAKALELYRNGEIEIYAYVIEPDAPLPEDLSMMQVAYIETRDETEQIELIVKDVVTFLETGKRVHLRTKDRTRIVNLIRRSSTVCLTGWA